MSDGLPGVPIRESSAGNSGTPPSLLTARLRLDPFTLDHAPFILRLLNDPGFLHWVGDRNVRTPDQARAYLEAGPIGSFAKHGFGGLLITRHSDGEPLGMCGLFKRDALDHPDLGYALLAEHAGRGYAREAAAAVVADARDRLRLRKLLAITTPDHARSIAVLAHLGFAFERTVRIPNDPVELNCYALALAPTA
jgi:ribosomal-protein-alanine N-acetyltransferase